MEKLTAVFHIFDLNKNGVITLDEITAVLTSKGYFCYPSSSSPFLFLTLKLGVTFDVAAVTDGFKQLDKKAEGKLSLDAFLELQHEPLRSKFLPIFAQINK